MSKFTTTLKGLMALALGSFALGADAALLTVSDTPTDGQFADNTTWYIWQAASEKGYIVEQDDHKTSSKNNYLLTNITLPTAAADKEAAYWCFVGDATNGYSIYNKKGTAAKKLGVKNPGTGTNGENSIVKLYTADELSADNSIVTTFHIGTYGTDGVYFEYFTTKSNTGNTHIVLSDRSVGGEHLLSLWTNCGNAAASITNKFILKEVSAQDALLNQAKTDALAAIAGIGRFYHSQTAFNGVVAEINNASSTQQVNQCVERVMNAIDKKVIHLQYAANAEVEGKVSYLGVVGDGDRRIAKLLPEKGARTKWQIVRVPGTYTFKMRNTASDTYMQTSNNGLTTATGTYTIDFRENTSVANAVTLKFGGAPGVAANTVCMKVGAINNIGYSDETTLKQDYASDFNAKEFAWLVTPAGVEIPHAIPSEGGYFVIRNNRALTDLPVSSDAPAFPGSLLGCYTPDREKARKNATDIDNGVTFSNGVHVRQFMTGMQTIWKIVPQQGGEGYKIYSLMGEGENDTPLMGMTFSGDNNSEITITDNPSTVYFISPSSYDGYDESNRSPMPYGVAISSTPDATAGKCFYLANALEGVDGTTGTGDFHVKANSDSPATSTAKTGQGSVFYIERVSSTDVTTAKNAFIDYAKGHRMFELLRNVLTKEEIEYALEQKASMSPDDINSVADARAYLNLGSQAASTRAFEQLNGKVIRLRNRLNTVDNTVYYLGYKASNDLRLWTYNANVESNLALLWEVVVTNAPLREIKLKNYLTGNYIAPLEGRASGAVRADQTEAKAGKYNVSRYYSLDGQSFFANLLGVANQKQNNCLKRYEGSSATFNLVTGGTCADLGSHWTLENAVADAVKNTEVTLNYDKENKVIVVSGAALEKTANFPEAYGVTLTPAAATAALDGETATPVEVAVPNDKITKDGETIKVDLSELNVTPSNYTLNFPVGYFTINNKLAPALSTAVTVSEPTGIKEVIAAEKGAEVIYDLQGRRVSKAGKGVYIINGVKTLVK